MDAEDKDEDRPAWLAVDDLPTGTAGSTSRSRVVYVAAALPWLVVAFILARPTGAGPEHAPAPLATEREPAVPATESPASPSAVASEPATEGLTATITSSGGLVAVDEDEARAVAVVAARHWLTSVGPGATTDARDGLYAEHLVVEGVDHPGPGAAVVTVRALVLRVEGEGYGAVEVRRVAVPLRFDAGGAAPAGDPYLLPHTDPPSRPFELEPVVETELLLEAGAALTAAGYDVAGVEALHRTSSWPLIVTADVRSGDATERIAVWLRPHLGRLVVAGTRPSPPPSTPPEDLPSPSSDAGGSAGDDPHEHEEVAP